MQRYDGYAEEREGICFFLGGSTAKYVPAKDKAAFDLEGEE